jgi:hypothetical protein
VPPATCDGPQDVKAASELGIRRVLHLAQKINEADDDKFNDSGLSWRWVDPERNPGGKR